MRPTPEQLRAAKAHPSDCRCEVCRFLAEQLMKLRARLPGVAAILPADGSFAKKKTP